MFQYGEIILAVIALGLTFIAEFFAVPAMMGAAIYGTGVGRAFSFAGTFAKRTHIMGLVFFAIYSFVWLTSYPGLIYAATLVPSAFLILFLFLFLVHLVAMFITYPIVATAFMLYVEKKVAMKGKKLNQFSTVEVGKMNELANKTGFYLGENSAGIRNLFKYYHFNLNRKVSDNGV